ncbi:MAG: PhaM family polyhydroxyalkanoate granule multifunctional regulatory protein [Burkholderiales bacterium]
MDKIIGQDDVMDLFRKMMNPMGLPAQNPFMPVLDPQELEKKISELRTVELWLSSNLSLLQLSIKTLEYQQALLTPTEDKSANGKKPVDKPMENPFLNPDLWPWNPLQATTQKGKTTAAKKTAVKKRGKKPTK